MITIGRGRCDYCHKMDWLYSIGNGWEICEECLDNLDDDFGNTEAD